jgi:hypothetical protein
MCESAATPDKPETLKKDLPKRRTKTGCLTCRKRRIKCDEGKPHCNNCIKTNRNCEGYKVRLDFREGLNAKHRNPKHETAYELPIAPVNLQIPGVSIHSVDFEIVQQDSNAFSHVVQRKQKLSSGSDERRNPLQSSAASSVVTTPSRTSSSHTILPLPRVSPQSATSSPFPQLLHHIAHTHQQILTDKSVGLYIPTATHSPLMAEKIFFLFNYFVNNFGSSMTIISRNPFVPNILVSNVTDRRGLEHFWTYDAPLMALNNPHVLNAILALASVQYMNSTEPKYNDYEFNGMEYYQAAVHGLREDLKLQRHTDSLAALTTSLLLAFFETMYGDLTQWYKHMSGARDIINAIDIGRLAVSAGPIYENGPVTYLNAQSILAVQACDILSSFLHMDLMQSAIGRTQLLLPVTFWDQIPLRRGHDQSVYMYDLLLKISTKLTSWVAGDTERKEKLYRDTPGQPSLLEHPDQDLADLGKARQSWNGIRLELQQFENKFAEHLLPLPLRGPQTITPFGPSNNYSSSLDHFFVILLNMSWLILKRNNPDVPAYGFQTLRYTAQEGVPNMLEILRALPPTVPGSFGHIGNESLHPGQTVRLLVDMCVPIFFAAIQVCEDNQQEWILNWLTQCHKYTGWNTINKIITGIKKAWMFQKASIVEITKTVSTPPNLSAGSVTSSISEHNTPSTYPGSSPITSPGPPDPKASDLTAELSITKNIESSLIETAKGLL